MTPRRVWVMDGVGDSRVALRRLADSVLRMSEELGMPFVEVVPAVQYVLQAST